MPRVDIIRHKQGAGRCHGEWGKGLQADRRPQRQRAGSSAPDGTRFNIGQVLAKGTGKEEMLEIDQKNALPAHAEPKDELQSFNRAAIEPSNITTRSCSSTAPLRRATVYRSADLAIPGLPPTFYCALNI